MQFTSFCIQIHMFTAPIPSHPFLGIASHHFLGSIFAQIHIFTAPSVHPISGLLLFFQILKIHMFTGPISSHPFSGITSPHFPGIDSHLIIVELPQKIADLDVVKFDWIGDVDGFRPSMRVISIVRGIRLSIVCIEN
jgi:hypothetical protein